MAARRRCIAALGRLLLLERQMLRVTELDMCMPCQLSHDRNAVLVHLLLQKLSEVMERVPRHEVFTFCNSNLFAVFLLESPPACPVARRNPLLGHFDGSISGVNPRLEGSKELCAIHKNRCIRLPEECWLGQPQHVHIVLTGSQNSLPVSSLRGLDHAKAVKLKALISILDEVFHGDHLRQPG